MDAINSRLKELRTTLKLSQSEFADRLYVSRYVVVNAELGRAEIRPQYLEQVCETFNASPDWLATGEGEMFRPYTRNDAVSHFIGEVLAEKPDSFRRRLIIALSSLDDEDWEVLAKLADKIANEKD